MTAQTPDDYTRTAPRVVPMESPRVLPRAAPRVRRRPAPDDRARAAPLVRRWTVRYGTRTSVPKCCEKEADEAEVSVPVL
jgi:hypothetical protein